MKTPAELLGLSTLAATAVLVIAPAAHAGDAGIVSSGPEPNAAQAAAYWTPARMAAAKPADVPAATNGKDDGSAAATAGAPVSLPPSGSVKEAGAFSPLAATAVPRPYTDAPDRLNGKVFFTKSTGGNYVCSGTTINAENKSVVWTAGHCVHGGRGGGWHTNWVFVPAYSSSYDGHRPYGTWTARQKTTRTEWIVNSNFRQDVGAVVLNRLNSARIVDRTGGQGIQFNIARHQYFSSFGYPAASPFNGLRQYRCNSYRTGDGFPTGVGPATIKINCNMTGGCSGGGWLRAISSAGWGWVNGLNSYRYSNINDLYSPYHGNEALSVFNAVRNVAV